MQCLQNFNHDQISDIIRMARKHNSWTQPEYLRCLVCCLLIAKLCTKQPVSIQPASHPPSHSSLKTEFVCVHVGWSLFLTQWEKVKQISYISHPGVTSLFWGPGWRTEASGSLRPTLRSRGSVARALEADVQCCWKTSTCYFIDIL